MRMLSKEISQFALILLKILYFSFRMTYFIVFTFFIDKELSFYQKQNDLFYSSCNAFQSIIQTFR